MPARLNGTTSGYTELAAADAPANNTIVLPANNGSDRQTLIGNGAGALAFQWDAGSFLYRLNANYALPAATTAAQAVFGVGVTLAASTVYLFEANYLFQKSATASAHTTALSFGGTATLNNIGYFVTGYCSTSATSFAISGAATTGFVTTAASTVLSGATTATAATSMWYQIRGTVSVNAGGTFIPQMATSPSVGPYSTIAGSYIKFSPIGAAGSNSSQGTWS